MGITTITTVLNVADHELGVAWYSVLFGREPDRRPMEGSAARGMTSASPGRVAECAELVDGEDRPEPGVAVHCAATNDAPPIGG